MESANIVQQKRKIQAQSSFRVRRTDSVVEEPEEEGGDSDDDEGRSDGSITDKVDGNIGETSASDGRDSTANPALEGTLLSSNSVIASTANEVASVSSPRGSSSFEGTQFGILATSSPSVVVADGADRVESSGSREGGPSTFCKTALNRTTVTALAGMDTAESPAGGGHNGQSNDSKPSDNTAAKTRTPTAHAEPVVTRKITRCSVFSEGTEPLTGGDKIKNTVAAAGTTALPLSSGVRWPKAGVSGRAIHLLCLLPYLSHVFTNKAGGKERLHWPKQ